MKRWIQLAARCYPHRWRQRYGEEFGALLEDLEPGWRVFANVLQGAVAMQVTKGFSGLKVAAAAAVVGMILAAGMSFTVPRRYLSSAAIQVRSQPDPQRPAFSQVVRENTTQRLWLIQRAVTSRGRLVSLIQNPALDLYPADRRRIPMEDVVDRMRRDILVQTMGSPASGQNVALPVGISFVYPDQHKAQAVLHQLVAQFAEVNEAANQNQFRAWNSIWPSVPPPPAEIVEVLDAASLPVSPAGPDRLGFMAVGLASGFLLGLVAVLAMRRPRWVKMVAAFAFAGCVLSGAASFFLASRYTSTAVMAVTPPLVPEDPSAAPTVISLDERVPQLVPLVLSRNLLTALIRKPGFDLYPEERAKLPLEQIVERMRTRDIHVARLNASTFAVSFSYPDRIKAQAVTRDLVSAFLDWNLQQTTEKSGQNQKLREIQEHRLGSNLEVLDPATLPVSAAGPGHLTLAAAGFAAGLLLGTVAVALRRPGATLRPA